jgi:hypothetical protein
MQNTQTLHSEVLREVNSELAGLQAAHAMEAQNLEVPASAARLPSTPCGLFMLSHVVASQPYKGLRAARTQQSATRVATFNSVMQPKRTKFHGKGPESGNWKFLRRLWDMVDRKIVQLRGDVLVVDFKAIRAAKAQGLCSMEPQSFRCSLYTHGFARAHESDALLEVSQPQQCWKHRDGLFTEHDRALSAEIKRTDTESSRAWHSSVGNARYSARILIDMAEKHWSKAEAFARICAQAKLDPGWLRKYMAGEAEASADRHRINKMRAALLEMLPK